ncbi:MAG: UDP-3-O-(3-hydroxymyristoyl)glucosamine N-acyltransferase [Fimbriimonas sp.]
MEKQVRGWTLGELASLLDGELSGPADIPITHAAPAGSGDGQALTYAGDDKHLALAEISEVGAILVVAGVSCAKPSIRVASPKVAFGRFLAMCSRQLPLQKGIHETAVVDQRAHIASSASVGAYAVVEKGAVIGENCRVYPFCYVGENCSLAEGVTLYPHVVLYQDVQIGARSVIHAGTILGADGFGFVWDGERHQKMPQVGAVVIGADCEVGALSAIDRATMEQTSVGDDTKIDNMVQVGHNTHIGEHVILASGVGISGSSVVGDRVKMAGMVGVGDHVTIADDVTIAARSATTTDVPKAGVYMGFPLRPLMEDQRLSILYGRLPDMAKRIQELERRIAELEFKG